MIKDHQKDITDSQMEIWHMISALGSGYAYWIYYIIFCLYTGNSQLHRIAYYGAFFTVVGFTMNTSKMYF